MEYSPTRMRRESCEIHTETITHVDDKDDGTQCWKKQGTTVVIFVPPNQSEGHFGRCRTADGGIGNSTVVSSSSVHDCKAQCAERSNCVAMEYSPTRMRRTSCEIHTETITHVDDKGDGTQCWKKQVIMAPDYYTLPQTGYCRTSSNEYHCWLNVDLHPFTQEGCSSACA